MEQRDDDHVAGSHPGREPGDADTSGCLSTDDVLAHLDQRLDGARLQLVRDHLDACAACRVVMAEAARVAANAGPAHQTPRTLSDGEQVGGRYEIRRFIARGGMGEVYEAFDSALGEVVALKTLAITAVDQTDAVKRLLAEVRIARKVTHPNVCRILEFGTHQRAASTDQPVPFLTMPLLHGETLARRLQSIGRMPPRDALLILSELAAGLEAVHAVGVVHRDLKSDNVFLVKGAEGGERAVVMDFGLARALETQGDRNKTTGRVLIGTPAYMAPEQVEGKPITKAVDVYAFGVVAFELITGRVPFVAESAAAVALARLQRGAAPPSSLVPNLDKRWDAVIQRCLRRGPEQRYPSMSELAIALELLRGGTRRPPWRRAPALMASVATLAALAVWIGARHSGPGAAARMPELATTHAAAQAKPPVPAVPPSPPARLDIASPAPTPAIPPQRVSVHAKRKPAAVAPPPSTPPPAPGSAAADVAKPAAAPFARPAVSRPRQPDDLVDPF